MADDKAMPVGMAFALIQHQIVKPMAWPTFATIEKAVRAMNGTYTIGATADSATVTVRIQGAIGVGMSDEVNQAATIALLECLKEARPLLPGFDQVETIDTGTGEIATSRTRATRSGDLLLPTSENAMNKAEIARAFSAKGDGSADVVYDDDIGEYRTREGDIYASGSVEDAVGAGR